MRALASFVVVGVVAGLGCATSTPPDPGLEGLALEAVAPTTIIPGTRLHLRGVSFVESQWGTASLRLAGDADGEAIELRLPATFVDFSTMTVAIDAATVLALGGSARFRGTARVDIIAASDGETYSSDVISVDLEFRETLVPNPTKLAATGVIFVNDRIEIAGDGFLLGGDEGETVAQVTGCFRPEAGGACAPVPMRELAMAPAEPFSRERATFPFSPRIAGIRPGAFVGQVTVINRQPNTGPIPAPALPVDYDLVTSQVFKIDPPTASLGQYVFAEGGGFVGGEANALTELELVGTFTRPGLGTGNISLTLIPEFVEGRLVRYIVNTDDELGSSLDLRNDTGQFTGAITPIVSYGADRVRGVPTQVSLGIAPVKQIVYLQFQPSYVEGLRDFGLRAVDKRIRERIVAVCREAYAGINIDFRTEPPTDFALFANVELLGVDPNGAGLFGYDNTPGKDNGNLRLYDRLGGVNAATQQDGYPGFGGVFVRSLLAFSKHPGSFATSVPGADAVFDKIFDPFRADLGNEPIRAADLTGAVPALTDGAAPCPASDRTGRIACAIYVLGNLIGGTLAHEIGHSLGLANPYLDGFHNAGDQPNRLMDAGGDRPFLERAHLGGQGPGVFCDDEYEYMRTILPTGTPAPAISRPGCF